MTPLPSMPTGRDGAIFRERRGASTCLGLQLAAAGLRTGPRFFAPVVSGSPSFTTCSAPCSRAAPRLGCSYYRHPNKPLATRNVLS